MTSNSWLVRPRARSTLIRRSGHRRGEDQFSIFGLQDHQLSSLLTRSPTCRRSPRSSRRGADIDRHPHSPKGTTRTLTRTLEPRSSPAFYPVGSAGNGYPLNSAAGLHLGTCPRGRGFRERGASCLEFQVFLTAACCSWRLEQEMDEMLGARRIGTVRRARTTADEHRDDAGERRGVPVCRRARSGDRHISVQQNLLTVSGHASFRTESHTVSAGAIRRRVPPGHQPARRRGPDQSARYRRCCRSRPASAKP